jgi:succinate dehydrogenase / fumarate reductase cytochrome b subunit
MANRYLTTSIGRKFLMALSAIFLMIFLLQHLAINSLSVLSPNLFNSVSHFMGYNPLVQFLLQPILIGAVLFHFIMGFVLEIKNKQSRGEVGYAYNNASQNSSWVSRNMIYSGATILAFLALHFIDFWVPEIAYKYVNGLPLDAHRYHEELVHKFQSPLRVGAYVLAFVLLALHLLHGFQSAFQSIGARHPKYQSSIVLFGKLYGIAVPAGFIFIAIYHYVSSLS